MYNGKSITEAGLKVLEIFRGRMNTPQEAYWKLGEALVNCELEDVANEILNFPCCQ